MQTTEAMKRRIEELEEQRKAISTEIRQLKRTIWQREHYKPEVCPCYDGNRCGYPINEMYYTMEDKKKAEATFRRYVKKYCKGE